MRAWLVVSPLCDNTPLATWSNLKYLSIAARGNAAELFPVSHFRVTKVNKSNRNDRHRPGYVAPKRDGKLGVTGFLTPDEHATAKEIAQRKGMTITDLTTKALMQFINRNSPKAG